MHGRLQWLQKCEQFRILTHHRIQITSVKQLCGRSSTNKSKRNLNFLQKNNTFQLPANTSNCLLWDLLTPDLRLNVFLNIQTLTTYRNFDLLSFCSQTSLSVPLNKICSKGKEIMKSLVLKIIFTTCIFFQGDLTQKLFNRLSDD